MVAAVYSTDLTHADGDGDAITGYSLISGGGGGQNAITQDETDDYIQGTNCCSRNPFSSTNRGIVYNAAGPTVAADDAIYIWSKADVAQALASTAGGGIQICMGSNVNSLAYYNVNGNEDAFGGWKCYVIDPTISPSIGSTSALTYIGSNWTLPGAGPSKGFPFKIDAIRHGRYLTITEGDSGAPATFAALATYQGAITRQWGQFQDEKGSYLQQGGFKFGSTATACYFEDANRSINIADTLFVVSGFNRFEVENASSTVNITATSISALGTTSRGDWENLDNATVSKTNCTFTGMGTFNYLSNTTLTGTTYRNCQLVTTGNSTLTGCTFDKPNVTNGNPAVSCATKFEAEKLSNCTWNDNDSNVGYGLQITTSGSETISFTGLTFNNYSAYSLGAGDGTNGYSGTTTGNEALYFPAASGIVSLSISGGTGTPSFRTGGCTVLFVSEYNLTLKGIPSGVGVTIVNSSTRTELQYTFSTGADIIYTHGGGETVDILLMHANYDPNLSDVFDRVLPGAASEIVFSMLADNNVI